MPALASGNQINGGFYKGFFRSLLSGFLSSKGTELAEELKAQ
jgi:hypothetical protein